MGTRVDFVNVTGPEDLRDGDHRRKVHSHAMRAFRRRERMLPVHDFQRQGPSGSASSTTAAFDDAPNRLPGSSCPPNEAINGKECGTLLDGLIGASNSDPFDSMAVSLSSNHQVLVKHFAEDIGRTMDSLNPHSYEVPWTHIWLKEAMSSRLVFLATCSHASEHMDDMCGRQTTQLSLQLRGATLSMLKETLEDSGALRNDATLAVLVMLSGNALISGNVDELKMHNKALNKIIAARRGLAKTGYQGILRAATMWQNAPAAILDRLDLIEKSQQGGFRIRADLIGKEHWFKLLNTTLRQCRRVSSYLSETEPHNPSQEMDCIEERSNIEFSFIQLWKALEKHDCPLPAWVKLARCACLSGLLFSFCHLRGLTAESAVARKITASILSIARGLNSDELAHTDQEYDQEMMLWSMVVAVAMSHDARQRRKLAELADTCRERLQLRNREQLIDRLKNIAWPGKWTASVGAAIAEVQTSKSWAFRAN